MPDPGVSGGKWPSTVGGILLLAVGYMLAANAGRLVAYGLVTPVWPPTGVALAALLLGGLRLWPGVALGELLTVVVKSQPFPPPIELPVWASLTMAAGNTLEAVLGAWLLRRFTGFGGSFDRVREVAGLIVFPVALGATVSATCGTLALEGVGAIRPEEVPDTWFRWWVGNALGVLVLTPFITAWIRSSRPAFGPARLPELCLLVLGIALAGGHSLLGAFPSVPGASRETYLLFPFLVWSALRFGPRVSATLVFVVATLALVGNAWRYDFDGELLLAGVLRVQVYVGVIAVSILLLASSVDERQRVCDRIEDMRQGLREEVGARTEELRSANRLLAARNEELAALNADLDSFASRVAHDLRAPVRAVSGFASLLRATHADRLDPEGLALLDRIGRAAARMSRLIDGLLEIARLGRRALDVRLVDMESLVRGVAENLEDGNRVEFRVGALPPCRGDAALLEEVVENLLQNAVKYTRGVEAPLVEVGGAQATGSVVYWVRDNGVGFPMADAPKLFRVFSRLHGGQFEGSGMGLAIVRRIVDLHGGHVWAEGTEGGGATFWFRLPMPEPAPRWSDTGDGPEHHEDVGGGAGPPAREPPIPRAPPPHERPAHEHGPALDG